MFLGSMCPVQVTQQIAAERRGLLQKERKRIAEEMKHRRELATIMEENQRKVRAHTALPAAERTSSRRCNPSLGFLVFEGLRGRSLKLAGSHVSRAFTAFGSCIELACPSDALVPLQVQDALKKAEVELAAEETPGSR